MTKNKNHCSKCGVALKISFRKASERYRFLECNYYIPKDTKTCKRHGMVGLHVEKHDKMNLNYRCKNCDHKEIVNYSKNKLLTERKDNLFQELKFDRKMVYAIQE